MALKNTERDKVLELISKIQDGRNTESGGTASVDVQIGGTDHRGKVDHNALYIKNACARVVDEVTNRYVCDQTEEGLRVNRRRSE